MINKLRLIFNIIKHTFINRKEITVLNRNTGKVIEGDCKHKNTTEKKTVYKVLGMEEIYIYISCDDCGMTLYAGWKPLSERKIVYDHDKHQRRISEKIRKRFI